MNMQTYYEGAITFLLHKNCGYVQRVYIGDIVMKWVRFPDIEREWIKGYMDALIEYMQQNDINEI